MLHCISSEVSENSYLDFGELIMALYAYAVIEQVASNGVWIINEPISHWVFKTITEANTFKEKMESYNDISFRYIVLHLNKR